LLPPRPGGRRQLSAADAEAAVGASVRATLAAFKKRDGPALGALCASSRRSVLAIRLCASGEHHASAAQLTAAFTDPTKQRGHHDVGRSDRH